ncbi:MAG: hypothetical protein QM778_10735 [Myxococcales bacterium]
MNKKAIASALALGLASTASAQLKLKGSDTLFEMTQEMLTLCQISPTDLTYDGGGSSGGQSAMAAGTQRVAPMSRFINAAGCTGAGPGDTTTRSGYAHSLDAIGLFSDNTEDTTCDDLVHDAVLTIDPAANGNAGGDPATECPNCTGNQYVISQWQQVLRIVYTGRHDVVPGYNECSFDAPGATVGARLCNSDVRNTLVNNWGNLFQGGCTDPECTSLRHAFRRDDISGTTDTFLALISVKGMFASNGDYQGADIFCNGSEFEDKDPIRRFCSGNGGTSGENVCQRLVYAREVPSVGVRVGTLYPQLENVWPAIIAAVVPPGPAAGDLGLVLPIVMPTDPAQHYPNNNACNGDYKLAPMPTSTNAEERCPNGDFKYGGLCYWPVDAAGNFGCLVQSNFRPGTGAIGFNSKMDARVYNLTTRLPSGVIPTISRKPSAAQNPVNRTFINGAFYRIHQRTAETLATAGTVCRESNDTAQIGCLVQASPCSIGYAGLAAQTSDANGDPVANTNKSLGIRAPLATAGIQYPSKTTVRRFLATPAGGATGTCADYGSRYPLSRKLWFNTFVGFNNLAAAGATAAEQQLARCFSDRRFVDRAAKHVGFVTLTDNTCVSDALPNPATAFSPDPTCTLTDDNPSYEFSSCAVNP